MGGKGTWNERRGRHHPDVDAGFVLSGGTIGDYVWEDMDADGIQDAGEPGLSGITVNLYDSLGALVGTRETDDGGYYQFTSVAPGDYYLVFTAPAGYLFSPKHAGNNPEIDSDADATGQSDVFSIALGDVNLTLDAGLYDPDVVGAVVGDWVWHDLDQDGIQDAGEPGIPGMTVELLDANGTVLQTTVTDGGGSYSFSFLPAGTYRVRFSAPNALHPPVFTIPDAGDDDARDSDADPATGLTPLFTLAANEINDTIDAGLLAALEHQDEPLGFSFGLGFAPSIRAFGGAEFGGAMFGTLFSTSVPAPSAADVPQPAGDGPNRQRTDDEPLPWQFNDPPTPALLPLESAGGSTTKGEPRGLLTEIDLSPWSGPIDLAMWHGISVV